VFVPQLSRFRFYYSSLIPVVVVLVRGVFFFPFFWDPHVLVGLSAPAACLFFLTVILILDLLVLNPLLFPIPLTVGNDHSTLAKKSILSGGLDPLPLHF